MDCENEPLVSDDKSERVEIYFSARNLADLDVVTVTDSFLKVYMQETNKPRKYMHSTKVYWNDLNPDYAETLVTEYVFEIRQLIIAEVYHEASPPQLIGTVEVSLGGIFGSRRKGITKEILNPQSKAQGTMLLKCQRLGRGNYNYIEFNVQAEQLPSRGFLCFGGNYPMFRLYKLLNENEYLLYESEISKGNDPRFKRVQLNENKLCNNDLRQEVIVKVYNYSDFGAPSYIAETSFTVQDLMRGRLTYTLEKNSKRRGLLSVSSVDRYTKSQFSDYLMAGMEMALVICVDFTASNGVPKDPRSLHYHTPHKKSQYEEALEEATKIVMDYDADKLVPTYGFGAKIRFPSLNTGQKTHHYFPLNGNLEDPNLLEVEGVMQGYRNCMECLQFGDQTLFSPLLRQAMKECQKMKKQRREYMILLILTDGAINDKEEVMDLLVKCGRLPLSVIIVGIGDQGDWGIMHELDDDDCQMVDYQGNRTERDLVQFVEFSKHKNNGVELAREVLYQLPRQVEEYHMLVGMTPEDYHKGHSNDAIRQMKSQY